MNRRNWRGAPNKADSQFEASDAYIVRIVSVQNPVLRTLVAHYHHEYYDMAQNNAKLMPIEEALGVWRKDPRFIDHSEKKEQEDGGADVGGVFEDEAPDVDAIISEVMLQDSQAFNADQHDWYQRHKRALHIRAVVLITYQNRSKYARVTGEWCTLSRCVKLRIKGQIESFDMDNGQMPIVDTLHRGSEHGIELACIDSISGRAFGELLVEKGMHANECRVHVTKFFETPSAGAEQQRAPVVAASSSTSYLTPVVFSSSVAYNNARAVQGNSGRSSVLDDSDPTSFSHVAAMRQSAYEAACNNNVTVADLWQRIIESKLDVRKFLETEFISLGLRMVLLSSELDEMREMYDSREVQFDAVARGVQFVRLVSRLIRKEPHVLCFAKLRRAYGEQESVRALVLLPDLPADAYTKLVRRYNLKTEPVTLAAIGIYHNIMRYDVYGNGRPPGERGYSTGNMCTVFGTHENERNADYYHGGEAYTRSSQSESPAALRDYNSMTYSGGFALPGESEPIDADMRILLKADTERLPSKCTTENFISALRWMLQRGIIVCESVFGTGPYNRGVPVDLFFIAEVHELQQRIVTLLSDIYRRGIIQSTHHSPHELSDGNLIALYNSLQKEREEWRKAYLPAVKSMNEAANEQRTLVTQQQSAPQGASELNQAAHASAAHAAAMVNNGAPAIDVGRTAIGHLARLIATRERHFYAKYGEICDQLDYNHKDDAYPEARAHRWLERCSLLLTRIPPLVLDNGQPFADEQIAAIRQMRSSPVTVETGRGGVGKSETLSYVCKQYPDDQIMCVAFTGQVASDLSRRTQFRASTIHSVLFRHTRYLEALYRARAYRKHALERRNATPQSAGEAFDYKAVMECKDDRELRAYVEHALDAYPPFVSPFERVRVLIIDEMSLVPVPLFARLLEAAHNPAQGRFLERIIFVGDLDQLPAIGFGNIQSDVAHGMPHAVAQLVTNHRSYGGNLFALAQAIAEHRHTLPMPLFDSVNALREMQKKGGARADIVALHTMAHDLPDKLECVIAALGAIENEDVRRSIQCIATTNEEVKAANALMRWLYFGAPQLKKPERTAVTIVRRQPTADEDEDVQDKKAADRERIEAQLNMRVVVGDRIYLKKNSRVLYPSRDDIEPQYEKNFYNSRLLEAVQFYNAPMRITAKVLCRCGLCPPYPKDPPPNYRSTCMERLDLVPPARQQRALREQSDGNHFFEYHDHKMPARREPTRRIAVFREESLAYIELDVSRMLQPRSRYDFGFALTTHKMQGAQQSIIVYICTDARSYINWKYLYTAATRAQRFLVIMSSDDVFDQCVRRKEPVRRSSLWYHLAKAVNDVLARYPDSECSRDARARFPQMFADDVPADSDACWNAFEDVRYRTDAAAQRANAADDDDNEVVDSKRSASSSSTQVVKRAKK